MGDNFPQVVGPINFRLTDIWIHIDGLWDRLFKSKLLIMSILSIMIKMEPVLIP